MQVTWLYRCPVPSHRGDCEDYGSTLDRRERSTNWRPAGRLRFQKRSSPKQRRRRSACANSRVLRFVWRQYAAKPWHCRPANNKLPRCRRKRLTCERKANETKDLARKSEEKAKQGPCFIQFVGKAIIRA